MTGGKEGPTEGGRWRRGRRRRGGALLFRRPPGWQLRWSPRRDSRSPPHWLAHTSCLPALVPVRCALARGRGWRHGC